MLHKSVKPECFLAHGTLTCGHFPFQRTFGTLAWRKVLYWKKLRCLQVRSTVSAAFSSSGWPLASQIRLPSSSRMLNLAPRLKSTVMCSSSSWLSSEGISCTSDTNYGSVKPSPAEKISTVFIRVSSSTVFTFILPDWKIIFKAHQQWLPTKIGERPIFLSFSGIL